MSPLPVVESSAIAEVVELPVFQVNYKIIVHIGKMLRTLAPEKNP
jgi:hypothetical protein